MASKMVNALARARNLFTRRPTPTQVKSFCEKSIPEPMQTDLLSKSVGGDPFYQVPFQLKSSARFTAVFLIYFGIAFWAPPMIVHLQIYKRAQN